MKKKNVVILGSTGSIGENTLDVIRMHPQEFNVVGLTAYNSLDKLTQQVDQFQPEWIASKANNMGVLKERCSSITVGDVDQDLNTWVSADRVDVVVIGMRGSDALEPFLAAVRAGKIVAPANKEALVMAGEIIMQEAQRYQAQVVPIDSEQSAIFQCLEGHKRTDVKKITLTASGGALRTLEESEFSQLSVADILNHPRWKMGPKITVDSATLMNKGFEVIEAQRLFQLAIDEVEVIVHPEAIIHSMVEFIDGSVLAQLGVADMRLPIQYALTYPKRMSSPVDSLDLTEWKSLTFEKPDFKKFPLLRLAFDVAKVSGTAPAVLHAADDVAVEAFLKEKINVTQIVDVVTAVVKAHEVTLTPTLDEILSADKWARDTAYNMLETRICS